ncbi:MAG TPA: hypothetical protein VLA12_16005, partial [Planctomycetaceae bacterium]|nr:hypothetical protein [Planctomycetaceae bacterium]
PERSPARGFSTIFEREVGAAWNWVVHPEQAKRDSARPETAAFPRLLFVALAVLGGLTMFLPWAEIRIAQDTAVTSIERGARLTEAVEQTIPATAVWSSAAASGTCFLMLIVLILIPHRRSPGLIASGVLTLFSLAAFIHTLAYQEELPWSGSVTLPLEVRGQDAARLEASSAAPTGDREVTDSEAIASKVYTFRQKVSLKFFPDRVTYREGFYASLGLTLSLLFFSIISVRNAIMNREPKKETSESWSGTPLASLRFAVPAKGDLGTKIKFHFSGLGYELIEQHPGTWSFQRGRLASAFLETDIRLFPTRLTVSSVEADDQHWLINCHWSVRLMGSWAG